MAKRALRRKWNKLQTAVSRARQCWSASGRPMLRKRSIDKRGGALCRAHKTGQETAPAEADHRSVTGLCDGPGKLASVVPEFFSSTITERMITLMIAAK